MRSLTRTVLWLASFVIACKSEPEWLPHSDGARVGGEDSGADPSDYSKDGEGADSADDNGRECSGAYKGDQLENPRNKCEARAACNHTNTCGNHGTCLTPAISRGEVGGSIHPTPLQACGRYLELNAMVAPVSGALVLQIDEGEVVIAIFADWDNCRPVGEFPCNADTVATAEVTADMVVYWFVAGGDGSEFEIGVGGSEKVPYTLRWEINGGE